MKRLMKPASFQGTTCHFSLAHLLLLGTRRALGIAMAFVVLCASFARGQLTCEPAFLPGDTGQPILGSISALKVLDLDGTGPQTAMLFAGGGGLRQAPYSAEPVTLVAAYDGSSWRSIASTPANVSIQPVRSLVVYNNELIAAGSFTSIGGVTARNIAAWNGTSWRALGQGVGGSVLAMEVFNGSLYVGGSFGIVGGIVVAPNLARWDGSTWSAVVSEMSNPGSSGIVNAIRAFSGRLYVGGSFQTINGVAASNLAVLNNGNWFAFGNPNGGVTEIEAFTSTFGQSSRLIVSGAFSNVDQIAVSRIASWSPQSNTWAQLGSPPGFLRDILVRSTGANSYQLTAAINGEVYTYANNAWVPLAGTTHNSARGAVVLSYYAGQHVMGSDSSSVDEVQSTVKVLQQGTWNPLGPGTPYGLSVVHQSSSGQTIASVESPALGVARVVRRNPGSSRWEYLGGEFEAPAFSPAIQRIEDIAVLPNGDIVVTGRFSSVNSVALSRVARWNGTTWTSMGGEFDRSVLDSIVLPNGDLVVCGFFASNAGAAGVSGIARWNGTQWTSMGGGIPGGYASALALLPNGDLLVAGDFAGVGSPNVIAGDLARWNGTSWSAFSSNLTQAFFDDIESIAVDANGNVAVLVNEFLFSSPSEYLSSVRYWTGANWLYIAELVELNLPNFPIRDIEFGRVGELFACGQFQTLGGVNGRRIARWQLGEWTPLGLGIDGGAGYVFPEDVIAAKSLFRTQAGEILAAGNFWFANGNSSVGLATISLTSNCGCDPIDFNADTLFPDDADLVDFLSVLAGGECSTGTCNDIDFNNDGLFPDDADLLAFLTVLAGGSC